MATPPAEFDRHAGRYRDLVEGAYALPGVQADLFGITKALELGRLAKEGVESALDVGCGTGSLHPFVTPLFGHLSGVDVSGESIALAASANSGVDYKTYDGTRLPFADASFDLAFAVCVVHHVAPAAWAGFVAEMVRVVRPGGRVALIEHNPLNPMTLRTVARCPFDEDAVLLGHRTAARLLASVGLQQVTTRFFPFVPMMGRAARAIDACLAWLPLGAQYICSGTKAVSR